MKQKMMKKTTQTVIIGLLMSATAVVGLTGCQAKTSEKATVTAESKTTAVTPTKEATVAEKYKAIIADYMKQIPAVEPGQLASEDMQNQFVKEMENLFAKKADSKSVHKLYEEGITQLAPKAADKFTALAIAMLRKNSFNDYTAIESYSNDPKFVEKFFKEAESIDLKYVKFNRQSDSIKDKAVQELVQGAMEKGYYISSSEGMLYYLVDFTEFAKYRSYNSPGMAAILETMAIDDLEPMMSDAAFIVDTDNVAARAYNIESLIPIAKGSVYEQFLGIRFKDHMNMLFFGTNNTPAYDYDTNRVSEVTVDLFKRLQTLEGTKMAALTTEYMALLEANEGKLDDGIRAEVDKLITALGTQLGVDSQREKQFSDWMTGENVSF